MTRAERIEVAVRAVVEASAPGSVPHTVRVRYRVPLPAAPAVVEGAVVDRDTGR